MEITTSELQDDNDESFLDNIYEFYQNELNSLNCSETENESISDIPQLEYEFMNDNVFDFFHQDESVSTEQPTYSINGSGSVELTKSTKKNISSKTRQAMSLIRKKAIQKKEIQKKARLLKSIKLLEVPEDDIRRNAPRLLFEHFHSGNFKKLRDFLNEHAVEYLLFKYQATSPDSNSQVILPTNIEIRGIDALVSFAEAFIKAKPDQIYVVTDTIIRNNVRSCSTLSNIKEMGTCVYELLMTRHKSDGNSNDSSNDTSDITNLTELWCGQLSDGGFRVRF